MPRAKNRRNAPPLTRSENMARIRSKDTKPEMLVRRALHAQGFRFRLHRRELPGIPDLVLPRFRAVVFVHGCFWHAHEGCRYFKMPATRQDFWQSKLMGNRKRDEANVERLLSEGWRVSIIWECALNANASQAVNELIEWLHGVNTRTEIRAGHV